MANETIGQLNELVTADGTEYVAVVDNNEVDINLKTKRINLSRITAYTLSQSTDIKTSYESNTDTNAYTDLEKTKLANVEDGATADQTGAEIKTLYESNADTNAYTDAEQSKVANLPLDTNQAIADINTLLASDDTTLDELQEIVNFIKLNRGELDALSLDNIAEGVINKYYTLTEKNKLAGIETGATADQTGAEIKALYEEQLNTNEFSDIEKAKLFDIELNATADQTDAEIKTAYENNADTNAFTDAEKTNVADNTTARHTHSNKAILDKFGENVEGKPTYNGNDVDTTIAQRDVYDGLDSTDNTISLSAKQGKVLNDTKVAKVTSTDNAIVRFNGAEGQVKDLPNITIGDDGDTVQYSDASVVNSYTSRSGALGMNYFSYNSGTLHNSITYAAYRGTFASPEGLVDGDKIFTNTVKGAQTDVGLSITEFEAYVDGTVTDTACPIGWRFNVRNDANAELTALNIRSNGNIETIGSVGIGNANPSMKLDVTGGTPTTLNIAGFEYSKSAIRMLSTSGRAGFIHQVANDYDSTTNGAGGFNHIFPFDTPNVGYAFTSARGTSLQYKSWIKTDGSAYFDGKVGIGISDPKGALQVNHDTDVNLLVKGENTVGGAVSLNAVTDNDGANIPLEIRGSKTIFSNGNVGIGITSPQSKLDVSGDMSIRNDSGGSRTISKVVDTSDVSTTATMICTAGNSGFVSIFGEDGGNQFVDLVFFTTYGDSPTVLASHTLIGTPATRTYTKTTSGLLLEMASGTYGITARAGMIF